MSAAKKLRIGEVVTDTDRRRYVATVIAATSLLLSLLVATPAEAQWIYGYQSPNSDFANSVRWIDDSILGRGVVVAGRTGSGGGHAWAALLDAGGGFVWSQEYGPSNGELYSIEPVVGEDGLLDGIVAAGVLEGRTWLVQIDPTNGSIQRQCAFESGPARFVHPTKGGEYVLAGTTWDDELYVAKTALGMSADQCEFEWFRTLGGESQWEDQAHSVRPIDTGGYIVAGRTWSYGSFQDKHGFVLKLSEDGVVNWIAVVRGETDGVDFYSVIEVKAEDGDPDGFLAVGHLGPDWGAETVAILTRVNTDGTERWTRFLGFDLPLEHVEAVELVQMPDGGLAVVGDSGFFGPNYRPDLWYLNFRETTDVLGDPSFEVEWIHKLNESAFPFAADIESYAGSIDATPSGGAVIGGGFRVNPSDNSDVWLMRLNEEGEVPPDCTDEHNLAPVERDYQYSNPWDDGAVPIIEGTPTNELAYDADFFSKYDCRPCVVRVNLHQTFNPQDGLNWETAFDDLQAGIDEAYALIEDPTGRVGYCEVWVAQGDYHAFVSSADDTIQLRPGVHVYGGFSGGDPPADYGWEGSRDDRDWEENVTRILGTSETNPDDRVRHVVTGESLSTLDGFHVGMGRALGSPGVDRWGAGMLNQFVSPKVQNCTFFANWAWWGGGMANIFAQPQVINCDFVPAPDVQEEPQARDRNLAFAGGGMINVGWDSTGPGPRVDGCRFAGNRALFYGGGMYNETSPVAVVGAVFDDNRAFVGGGAANAQRILGIAGPRYRDCTFANNDAMWLLDVPFDRGYGGGMANFRGVTAGTGIVTIVNALFYGNTAESTGAAVFNVAGAGSPTSDPAAMVMFGGTVAYNECLLDESAVIANVDSIIALVNSVVYTSIYPEDQTCGASILDDGISQSYVEHSDVWFEDPSMVWPGPGSGNINSDPDYVLPGTPSPDYHLLSTSSCIDTGTDVYGLYYDIEGSPRIDIGAPGPVTDMGAFEYWP